MSNVFSLHPPKHPISHVVRIGHTGHKILENLYTAEKLTRRLAKKSDRLELMYQTLERLNSDLESVPIALSPISNVNPVKKAG